MNRSFSELDLGEGGAGRRHALHDEEQQPKGRRGEADLERQEDDDREPDGIEAVVRGEGEEDRHREQHHRELVHEGAQDQQYPEHDKQHPDRRHVVAGDPPELATAITASS